MAICKDPAGQSSAPDVHKPPITMLRPITHNPNFLEIFCGTPPSQLGFTMFNNVTAHNTQLTTQVFLRHFVKHPSQQGLTMFGNVMANNTEPKFS